MTATDGLSDSFLGGLGPELRDTIRQRAVVQHYRRGDIVVSETDGHWIGIVVSGMARIFLRTPAGRQVTLRHAQAASSIGIGSLFGEAGVSAQAVTDCTILRLDHAQVLRLAEQDAPLAATIAKELSIRLHETYLEIVVRQRGSLRQRLARQLLDFAGELDPEEPLVLPMSHEDLAEAVGSAREVVTRHLSRFQAELMIALDRGKITLTDPVRLDQTAKDFD